EDPVENYFPASAESTTRSTTAQASDGTGGAGGAGASAAAAGGSGGKTTTGGAGDAGAAGQAPASGGTATASSDSGGSGGSSSGGTGGGGTGGTGGSPIDCGPAPTHEEPFTKERLRAAAADCALYQYCQFEGRAHRLENAIAEHAIRTSDESLAHAQNAWRAAMQSWQVLEVFQFGPLANPSATAGKDGFQGTGLRDKIYAWPLVARCRVDEQVVGRSFVERGMDGALISGRGLYALETLLFYSGAECGCAASTSTAQTWQSLAPTTLDEYRRDYALAASEDVVDQIQGLVETWTTGDEPFYQKFVSASGYPSEQEAMNVLAWALVYIEKEVKDYKLGIPAGYTLIAPVSEPEAPYAGVAYANVVENLRGFRSLFQGCGDSGEGLGFDDWLIEAGHAALAADIIAAWQTAFQTATNLASEGSDASEASVEQAYLDVKRLTDLLKNDLLGTGSPLNLDLPDSVAGDTD
ncbi:MAG TPA: imelysin family protein, partial [Polyangiaceae bacterium]|nr:imelysin family protein [Polyangiaceae bacterium]